MKYLANTIPIISCSHELLFERFIKYTSITKSAEVLPTWQRNSEVSSPVDSPQYIFTNSIVPNEEPIINNSIFDDLSCGSGESLVDTNTIHFKDVTSLFYYFRFNYWSCYYR